MILIGTLALLAWAKGNVQHLRLVESLPPIHYNTALGLLLCGSAYCALGSGRYSLARVLAGSLALVASAVLLANLPDVKLNLGRWAFEPPLWLPGYPPGGCAPGFSLIMALVGVAVLRSSQAEIPAHRTLLNTLLGVVLVIGPTVVLLATVTGNPVIPAPGPAVLGGVGTIFAGLGMLASQFRTLPAGPRCHVLPLSSGVVGVVLTFALWLGLNAEQNGRLHQQTQYEASFVHRTLQERLSQELASFDEMADMLAQNDPEHARPSIETFVGRREEYLGVGQVDEQGRVTWIRTRDPSLPTAVGELGIIPPSAEAAPGRTFVAVRHPSDLNHTSVLVLYRPERGQESSPGVLALMQLNDLFHTAVGPNIARGYALTIADPDGILFSRFASEDEYRSLWFEVTPIRFHEFHLKLTVWPTTRVMHDEGESFPKLALLMGLFTSALLSVAVQLAQTGRSRARELEAEVRQRTRTQLALQQSEEKYRTLIENLEQGIFLQDREHRFAIANGPFCEAVARREAEIVGRTEADVFEAGQAAERAEEVRTVLAEGKTVETEDEQMIHGRRRIVRRVLTPVRDAAGTITGVLGICWDVTDQRQLEGHVHQASKMDAIGQLAGGIAHDFNNLLTAILGNLELILEDRAPDDSSYDLAVAAQNAALRAASLTQRLLGFSRHHQLNWVPTDINAIVREVVALLSRTIDPLIRIDLQLSSDLGPVLADPAQLNQVLMNLCLNARDAIMGTGTITIESDAVSAEDCRFINGMGGRTGTFTRLRITDTGCGMAEEVKARIYEPFFTTKKVGKGTGLGLPMVFAIVRQHKGLIDCWSEVGRGTRFDIYLPQSQTSQVIDPPVTPIAQSRREGRETILIVDDEEMIRRIAAATLQSHGYTVLEAVDGQEAVDLYSRDSDRIDLVLLDLTMPVLSGHEAFRHILKLNCQAKVLFASGYSVDQLSDLEKELMAGFLKKPYRPNELVTAIEQALRCGNRQSKPQEVSGVVHVPGEVLSSGDLATTSVGTPVELAQAY